MDRYRAGARLWEAPPERAAGSRLAAYMRWAGSRHGRRFRTYDELWRWSVEDIEAFWGSVWEYFDVRASAPYRQVLDGHRMPGARWFEGSRLNWARHVLRNERSESPALIAVTEDGRDTSMSWAELRRQVGALSAALRARGVGPGDRVAAVLPNIPQTVVALLAAASIGAVFACAAPEFGPSAVLGRLAQLEPSVLILVDGYVYGGRVIDRRDLAATVRAGIPGARHAVYVPYALPDEPPPPGLAGAELWGDLVSGPDDLRFEEVGFDHPLWVLFSSGTTGPPKGVVHGHGGILLESFKMHSLMFDLGPGDRLFFMASTGWVVWNLMVTALQVGATVVLFDGNPTSPDPRLLWRIAQRHRIRAMGFGSSYAGFCQKAGLRPGPEFGLTDLRLLVVTGSPLPVDGWNWVYEAVSPDVRLSSSSGGTEVCTAFVGGVELEPVYATELGPAWPGVSAAAWDDLGRPVTGEVGELVITEPMPSMPVRLWNDPDGTRYEETYFRPWPGVWRHGDRVTLTGRRNFVVHGRSDATINRNGVRMGSGEISDVVERIPEVTESLVVGTELPDGRYYLPLFVVLSDGTELDEPLRRHIAELVRTEVSPRAVPDEIVRAPAVPHTLTGKRLEVPVKRLLQGAAVDSVVNLDAVDSPETVRWYADFARRHMEREGR